MPALPDFNVALWLFAAAVTAHNLEEALWLPAWSRRHAVRLAPPVGDAEFRLAVTVLTLLLYVLAGWATRSGPLSVAAYLACGYAFAMAGNALVPHAAGSVLLRTPMPGVLSGLLLVLPSSLLVLRAALEERWVLPGPLAWSAPLCALALLASLPALFALGRRILRARPQTAVRPRSKRL